MAAAEKAAGPNPMDDALKQRTAAAAAIKEKEVQEKLERVKKGMEDAKKRRRAEEKAAKEAAAAAQLAKKGKTAPVEAPSLDDLYGGLPPPDPLKDSDFVARQKDWGKDNWRAHRFPPLPPEEPTKVIFLDVDGVLRPLTAGGFRSMMVDGEWALRAETADFISSSLLALRHIVEETGSLIVLSSEWRRDLPMRQGVDNALAEYEMRPCVSWTPTDLARDMGTENPFKAFTERRAREVSQWISNNPQVKQWVVIDDINMADADEGRKVEPTSTRCPPPTGVWQLIRGWSWFGIVQTHRKIGLTMEQAKAAVRILRGEKLPPQILPVQPHIELTG
ncbi:unnamed protein product [Prorocentrum cordatum]|uniref:Mitochondrial import inner membrane translocase subunit TIM50 n=1 Tax=Prorocentrum cordatum TaxID=2364126 RepID=A0ABN9T494_9DINO|nr:unnamed protein product [Polarella glacialis]